MPLAGLVAHVLRQDLFRRNAEERPFAPAPKAPLLSKPTKILLTSFCETLKTESRKETIGIETLLARCRSKRTYGIPSSRVMWLSAFSAKRPCIFPYGKAFTTVQSTSSIGVAARPSSRPRGLVALRHLQKQIDPNARSYLERRNAAKRPGFPKPR